MEAFKGKIQIGAPFPGTSRVATAPGILDAEYVCRRDSEGRRLPQIGQPVVYATVSRGATPAGGVADQSLYLDIEYTYDGVGGSIRYTATNGGRFALPPCDSLGVSVSLEGSGGPEYIYSVSAAWEQPASGAAGTYITRPFVCKSAVPSDRIYVPSGFSMFYAEGDGSAADLAGTTIRKFRADSTLISAHDGAEDMMSVGEAAFITWQGPRDYNMVVNFLSYFS